MLETGNCNIKNWRIKLYPLTGLERFVPLVGFGAMYRPFFFSFSSREALTFSISKLCAPMWSFCHVKVDFSKLIAFRTNKIKSNKKVIFYSIESRNKVIEQNIMSWSIIHLRFNFFCFLYTILWGSQFLHILLARLQQHTKKKSWPLRTFFKVIIWNR